MSRFDLFYVVVDEREERLDTQIATHIIDLHKYREEAITPKYSSKDVLTYLKFCKHIKPKFTKDAMELLKKEYVRLRANDGTSQKTSYRITVRQLESLIRLSEAMAKVHADNEIRVPYVEEAVRLLSKSIITIQHDDVEMEAVQARINQMQESRRKENEEVDMQVDSPEKQKVRLGYEEYEQISKNLIRLLVSHQNENADDIGITQQDLLSKYLNMFGEHIETMD